MGDTARMTLAERETYTRARRHFERGEDEPALEAFESLLETRDNFADIHYMVGVLFDRRGDANAAVESLRTALQLNPSYAEALLALATIYERRGDFDQSQELAERAAMLAHSTPGTLDVITRGKLANLQAAVGDAYAEVGERRDAIEAYRKALDRCPDFHDIRHRLGVVLREAGLPAQAAQEFKRILRANESMLDSRIQLGLTWYSLGRSEDALAEWEAVLEQDPGREDARMYIRLVSGETDEDGDAEADLA